MLPSEKKCRRCSKVKDEKEFYVIYSGYKYNTCKGCYKKMNTKRYKELKDRKKKFKLW
tara:strand:+ start:1518 stop:1691 length:174 start_codon:yes stop_codon:yes gene_type:complete